MTTNTVVTPEAERIAETTDLHDTVQVVRQSLTQLLRDVPEPPTRIRVRAGEVSMELEWEQHAMPPVTATTAPATTLTAAAARPAQQYIHSSSVGVFYRAPEPGATPFVAVGDMVTTGQQVAIVEAMKLMLPVEADRSGRITEVLRNDGDPAEYGEPLFAITAPDQESS